MDIEYLSSRGLLSVLKHDSNENTKIEIVLCHEFRFIISPLILRFLGWPEVTMPQIRQGFCNCGLVI